MSADNFVIVRQFGEGWRWGMGFASDEYPNDRLPDDQFDKGPFATPDEAVQDAEISCGVIEYGVSVEGPEGDIP